MATVILGTFVNDKLIEGGAAAIKKYR